MVRQGRRGDGAHDGEHSMREGAVRFDADAGGQHGQADAGVRGSAEGVRVAPRPPAALAEQQTSHAESDALSDGLSDALRELALAGGDLPALGALATGESRSELTTALKALGFKGLKTRQELEQQLREWQEVQ